MIIKLKIDFWRDNPDRYGEGGMHFMEEDVETGRMVIPAFLIIIVPDYEGVTPEASMLLYGKQPLMNICFLREVYYPFDDEVYKEFFVSKWDGTKLPGWDDTSDRGQLEYVRVDFPFVKEDRDNYPPYTVLDFLTCIAQRDGMKTFLTGWDFPWDLIGDYEITEVVEMEAFYEAVNTKDISPVNLIRMMGLR